MKMKKQLLLLLTVSMFLVVVSAVSAQTDPGAANVTDEADRGQLPAFVGENTTVEAGNVSQANLDTNTTTFRWAGLVGNVTGNIVLGDGSGNSFYSWTAQGNLVYASEAGTVTWASLAVATDAQLRADYTFLGGTAGDNSTNTVDFAVTQSMGSNIFSLSPSYANVSNAGTDWLTFILHDGTQTLFAGDVVAGGTGYDGETVDYQMLLPEDGTSGDTATSEFNLWVELI